MRRGEAISWIAVGLLPLLASTAFAQDAGTTREAAAPVASSSAGPPEESAGSPEESESLPAGHPPLDDANPHARAGTGAGGTPGVFEPPEDVEQPDPALPAGVIVVDLHDGDERPVPREQVTLGVLINSVAKGDSRKHLQSNTDEHGRVVFSGLDLASNIAYRVSAGYQ